MLSEKAVYTQQPMTDTMTKISKHAGSVERRSVGEVKPIFRGLSHLLAFASALTLAPILIVVTPGVADRFIMAIYAVAIVGLFGISAMYHRINWGPKGTSIIRRMDHSMIFIATAATHTPIALIALPRSPGWILFAIVWTGAALGIAGRLIFAKAPYWVVSIPYVVVGWSSIFVINHVWASLNLAAFILLLVGGALYTVGAIIYALHRPNPWPNHFGYHEIFHLLTIGGAACHYVVIAIFVRGLAG